MSDVRTCKDALARLATRDRDVVARAAAATTDLDAAVRFREAGGLARLDRALRTAEGDRAVRGAAARRAFTTYRAVARGNHFHPGHDTHIRRGGKVVSDDAGDSYG